jgi:hypothetical protein
MLPEMEKCGQNDGSERLERWNLCPVIGICKHDPQTNTVQQTVNVVRGKKKPPYDFAVGWSCGLYFIDRQKLDDSRSPRSSTRTKHEESISVLGVFASQRLGQQKDIRKRGLSIRWGENAVGSSGIKGSVGLCMPLPKSSRQG